MSDRPARSHLINSLRELLKEDMEELKRYGEDDKVELELPTRGGGTMKQRWIMRELLAELEPVHVALNEALDDVESQVDLL